MIEFVKSFKHLSVTVRCVVGIAFAYGIQELLTLQFFRCPCSNYAMYSFSMLAAPSLFLVGVGFSSCDSYWQVILRRRNITNYKQRLNYCLKSLPSLLQPFILSAAFVVFVLLRGEFYACAKVGGQGHTCMAERRLDMRMMTSKVSSSDVAKFYMQSQIFGCGILAGVTIFAMGIVFIRNCCFDHDVIPDTEDYRHVQHQALSAAFRHKLKETIEKEAEKDVADAFDGESERESEIVFKQARDQIQSKRSLKQVGRFSRLTQNEDDNSSVRIIDSSL